MTSAIDAYFQAEQAESVLFVAIGVVAVLFSSYLLWRYGDLMSKGLAVPLIAVGLIQMVVGGTVYLRTPAQMSALKAQHAQDPKAFRAAETPRMETVISNFHLYKVIEVVFIVVGLGLTLSAGHPFWLGIGMGMLVQGALMLLADITAMQRGEVYLQAVAKAG